jgi:hypothetical protein
MTRFALAFILAGASASGAFAQMVTNGPAPTSRTTINGQLVQLLADGFEIKAAFAEAGVPYVILQKQTSAYLCRGGAASGCEKLN